MINQEGSKAAKQLLLEELVLARTALWESLDGILDTLEIYPGVTKREFLAHIAGWDAMVFDYFRFHIFKHALLEHGYEGVDHANARFVSTRMSTTVHDAKLECEINRFAILTLLGQIEDIDELVMLPWGSETVAHFLEGAIEHERSHLADILALENSS